MITSLVKDFSAAALGVAAVGSFAMALMTRESIKQNEQHHMDDARPILMIVSESGKNLDEQQNREEIIKAPTVKSISKESITVKVEGGIKNNGKGIANNIRVMIKFNDNERMAVYQDYPPVAPGETIIIGEAAFYSKLAQDSDLVDEFGNFKKDVYENICKNQYGWSIYLYYEDIFRNKFVTLHSKSVVSSDKSWVPWSQFPNENKPQGHLGRMIKRIIGYKK